MIEGYQKRVLEYANKVFHTLGPGYSESIYQKALSVELRNKMIPHEQESIMPILYEGFCVGHGRADIVVFTDETKLVIELKAVSTRPGESESTQLKTYLRAANLNHGMVINFPQSFKKNDRPDVDSLIITFKD